MSEIKRALTRKFGPLPAWAWALIAGAGLYFYRARGAGGASARSSQAALPASVAPTPAVPQSPLTVAPGESVYDPNTGALLTPGGGAGQGPSNLPDDSGALNALAKAIDRLAGPARRTKSKTGAKTGKRKGKRGPAATGKSVQVPTHSKARNRSNAHTRSTGGRKRASGGAGVAPTVSRSAPANGATSGRARSRAVNPNLGKPAIRQRPEPAIKPAVSSAPRPAPRPSTGPRQPARRRGR